jgi:hypothetical protein
MTTALDMIQDAAERLGVYAPGETISAADSARFLKVLNDMIDSWSTETLTTFAVLEQSAQLVVGQTAYTIGTGGNFNMTRPIRILDGPGAAFLVDVNGNRYPIDVVPQDKWNQLWNITQINSNLPSTIFYDPQFPLGIINVWPNYAGGLGVVLHWNSYLQLSEFLGLTSAVSLPPGYVKAIQDNLAVEAAPYFKGDNYAIPQLLLATAARSKGNIKRSNLRLNIAQFEKVLTARGGAVYNIYSDSWR